MSEVLAHRKPLKHELAKHIRDVLISSPADGHVLTYEAASLKWKNKAPVPGTVHRSGYIEGTTDISTSSASYVTMPNTSFSIDAILDKRFWWLFYCAINGDTAGIMAYFILQRSTTAGGSIFTTIGGGSVYVADVGSNFVLTTFVSALAPYTGQMNMRVQWCSPSGHTIYNDGSIAMWRRKNLCVMFLD